jgi:hypothetical protein
MHGDTPAVAVINDLIYVAGGSGAVGNEVEFYDPAQDAWTTLTPMDVPRNHTAGGTIGGKFYVAGGRPGNLAASALEVYEVPDNRRDRAVGSPVRKLVTAERWPVSPRFGCFRRVPNAG